MARKQRPYMVVTQSNGIDLTDAPADINIGMVVPGDGARIVDWSVTIMTAGVGSFNHEMVLEQGLAGAGVAVSPQLDLLADGAVGLTATGEQLDSAVFTRGTALQILNAEEGSITTGAIVNIVILWAL